MPNARGIRGGAARKRDSERLVVCLHGLGCRSLVDEGIAQVLERGGLPQRPGRPIVKPHSIRESIARAFRQSGAVGGDSSQRPHGGVDFRSDLRRLGGALGELWLPRVHRDTHEFYVVGRLEREEREELQRGVFTGLADPVVCLSRLLKARRVQGEQPSAVTLDHRNTDLEKHLGNLCRFRRRRSVAHVLSNSGEGHERRRVRDPGDHVGVTDCIPTLQQGGRLRKSSHLEQLLAFPRLEEVQGPVLAIPLSGHDRLVCHVQGLIWTVGRCEHAASEGDSKTVTGVVTSLDAMGLGLAEQRERPIEVRRLIFGGCLRKLVGKPAGPRATGVDRLRHFRLDLQSF